MIDGLKPYPAYQHSGVPWLGEVPAHWQLQRMKSVLRERSEKGYPHEALLAATQSKGVVRKDRFESRTVTATKDLHLLKLVRVGDFVISLRSFQGGIEHALDQGIISPAYTVLTARELRVQRYLRWLFKSRPFIEGLSLFVTGIREGQNIDYVRLSRSEIPLPSPEETEAIVRFLDHADRRIRRYIRAKQKLIKLLEQQRDAIIHRAVARGLNPSATTKPSGIDWLGELPEHWSAGRFKDHVAFQEGPGIMAADFRDQGVPLLRISCLAEDVATLEGCNFLDPSMVSRRWRHFAVEAGDYLLSASGSLGTVSRATETVAGSIPYTGIIRLWPRREDAVLMEYVRYFMASELFAVQVRFMKAGVGIEHFGPRHLNRMLLIVPPLPEQAAIVAELDRETTAQRVVIESANRQIALAREFRSRLIADVVTGKLDVREAAARLPNMLDEEPVPDSLDDDATSLDGNDADVEGMDPALLDA